MVTLTDNAVTALRSAIEGAPGQIAGLRILVETGGCAGMKYCMGLVAATQPDDLQLDSNGVKLFIDPISFGLLQGVTVDFVTGEMGAGFVFDNPGAGAACSCGKSFT
jgi:iron-sulfur cluster assembly protein